MPVGLTGITSLGDNSTMQNKRAFVLDMFATIAGTYDFLNTWLSFGMDRRWRIFTVKQCALKPGDRVLDVATGTLMLARTVLARHPEVRLTGADFSPEMLRVGLKRLGGRREGQRLELVLGDALQLPFADASFDCVTVGYALRNVIDVPGLFREAARVVKPGGRVVTLELTRPSQLLLRWFYYLYLFRIAPWVGGIISGKREAYTYLPDSIREFPEPEAVAGMMRAAGLEEVRFHRLTLGSATVHVGVRPGA